jgi:drug/metabolite transporter (DMT)-like permease
MAVSAVALAMTALLYLVPAVAEWPITPPSTDALVSLALLGVVCTALAFVVFAALIGEIGPVRATVITYVNPAVATVLGIVILDEQLTLGLIVGFVLVLLGSFLATRPGRPTGLPEPLPAGSPST